MDYQEFKDQISKQIKEYFPPSYQNAKVEINQIPKNNNQVLDGLLILREGDTLVPQIYLNGYFELYENGVSISEIMMDISARYFQNLTPAFENMPTNVTDYAQVKNLLTLHLINKDMNEDMLKNVPHKDFMDTDLTAVVKIPLKSKEHESATMQVSNELLKYWGLDIETIYQDALANTVREQPAQIISLSELMYEMMFDRLLSGKEAIWEEPESCEMKPYEQYVLTNPSKMFGAATLLYPSVLQQLSDNMKANFFILPSSIHELLLLKDNGELSAAELQAMVMDVNQETVPFQDQLSDCVYYYDGKEHTLSMATTKEETAELGKRLQQSIDFTIKKNEPDMGQEL